MPPVKQNWRLIAETALKDAASAEARLIAANHALDNFRAEVSTALDALRAEMGKATNAVTMSHIPREMALLSKQSASYWSGRLDATITALNLPAPTTREKE